MKRKVIFGDWESHHLQHKMNSFMNWLRSLHEGEKGTGHSRQENRMVKVMKTWNSVACGLNFRGFPVAGIFVQRIERGRRVGNVMGDWKVGRSWVVKGVAFACHAKEFGLYQKTVNICWQSLRRVIKVCPQYKKGVCCSGGMSWMMQNQKQNPVRWPCQ